MLALNKRVCQISKTPLVGAPANLTRAINSYTGWLSELYVEQNYQGVREKFFDYESRSIDKDCNFSLEALERSISNAKVILIHNDVSKEIVDIIKSNGKNAKCIYITHSPQREAPLFCDIASAIDIDFDIKLCCAQYHWGIYPDYTPVPLIVNFPQSLNLYKDGEKIRILYLPSHKNSSGRWNSKTSDTFIKQIEQIRNIPLVEFIAPKNPIKPNDLYALRQTCHITIDEVITGTFHTISLEGLCAGNAVMNASTSLSNLGLQIVTNNKNEEVPFIYTLEDDVYDSIVEMIQKPSLLKSRQNASFEYYSKNLLPNNLVSRYTKIFDEICK